MINMITHRCWIATLMSVLFMTTFCINHEPTPAWEKNDLSGSDVSSVENTGPFPDLDDFEEVASEPIFGSLASVIESPYAATFTSQPIRTANLPSTVQVSQQENPHSAPTIQKPVPPNYQGVDPTPFDQPVVDDDEDDKDLDVLMRGPLHEAYAEVFQHDPKPSVIIDRQPPEPIDELPPEFKPDGENVEWIPGYWAWDDERNDFIWISGVWRNIPQGQRWVPGYWQTAGAGFRWVSGFWIGDQQAQVNYLPQPPESLDNGPAYPAPSDDHYYSPGNWAYQNNTYVWQSGYWAPRVAYRVWIPARYIWTPCGCVYRPGFWDYEFDQRGVVFAPVCFNAPVYRQVNYCYQPSYVINTNVDFMAHLFVRPTYCHYYFGDWYGPRYVSQNFYPWSNFGYGNSNFRAYDPLYSYYRCRSTRYNNVQALGWVQNQFSFYFQYQNYRPRHTYRGQREYVNNHNHDRNGRDAMRRASYGERYDDRIGRQRPTDGRSRGYKKVEVSDRIDSLAVSREISQRRRSQGDRPTADNHGKRTQAKLELPKTKPTSAKRDSVQLSNNERNRQDGSDIRIPDEVRRKFEGFEKQQAEKRQKNLSTKTRNPNPDDRSQGLATKQPERERPQVSRQLNKQPESAAKQPGSARIQEPRNGQRTQESQVRDQQQPQRNQKNTDKTVQRSVQKSGDLRRQQLQNRDQQKQLAVKDSKRQNQPVEAARQEQDRRAVESREKTRQDETRRQEDQVRQQRESEQRAKDQRDSLQRTKEAQSIRSRETQQRMQRSPADNVRAERKQQSTDNRAGQQLERQRSVQNQEAQRRNAAQQMQKQRDAQQRAADDQNRKNLEAQQRASSRQRDGNRADQQRVAEPQAQQKLNEQRRNQQQESQRREAQQQRDSQKQAQQRQQQAQRQRESQPNVQQQRDVQKQALQQRDAQRQREAQQKIQQQRDAQKQAQLQQQAQRQRDAQQQAQKQQQAQRQRDAQQQREAKRRSEQQRAQRESQQRSEQQSSQRQRESQQRAQRDAQNRAQREANRQKNSSKGKKK